MSGTPEQEEKELWDALERDHDTFYRPAGGDPQDLSASGEERRSLPLKNPV